MNKMNKKYLFLTLDPNYIRHAAPLVEVFSATVPHFWTQQAAEVEHQRRIAVLEATESKTDASQERYIRLAQKLKDCRNDAPCNSLPCAHCLREYGLTQLAKRQDFAEDTQGYTAVTLTFNQTKYDSLWSTSRVDEVSRQVSILKQRVSRTLKRLGYQGPIIGTFMLVRHAFSSKRSRNYWLIQLRLLLPRDNTRLKLLKKHMARGKGQYIEEVIFNEPIFCSHAKDQAKLLGRVLDLMWYEVACTLSKEGNRLLKEKPTPLSNKRLANSLVLLDLLGKSTMIFHYGAI
ncbi:Uncharacterised protein [Budvicia aquatica]|uniref:Replication protein n=2 Tax=Budvicia aquatica TaxID=82979 RepID=A0A2C6DU65_9GAMM|nr:hypothetical protein CRN84_23170 [Budvicia aquatica]VFS53076.1 Uncharacterised protein [Budvicia aquatica]